LVCSVHRPISRRDRPFFLLVLSGTSSQNIESCWTAGAVRTTAMSERAVSGGK